jgi:membrane-associated phospholipid phosphatase
VESAHDEERFLDTQSLDGMSDMGNVYGNGLTIAGGALGLVATGAFAHSPRLLSAGIDLAHSFLLSGALIVAIKTAAGRTRPNGGSYSFPSGHTGVAMSAAPVLAYHFGPVVGACAYAFAGATALGRMEDRYHYLSDVLFGATVGMAVGRTVVHERNGATLLSHLHLTPGGAALSYSF